MSRRPPGRRAALLGFLAMLGACATPEPPATVAPPDDDPDPDPERVYTPGPIPWANLTDEHKRRARQVLTRLGEDIPDEETLQARWLIMSPAQQRFSIRRPPPPPPPPRRSTRGGRTPARSSRPAPATTRTRRRR